MKLNRIGIDTLALLIDDYQIKKHNSLTIHTSYNTSSKPKKNNVLAGVYPESRNINDIELIIGNYAVYKCEKFRIDLKKSMKGGDRYLLIRFQLPTITRGNNLIPSNIRDAQRSLQWLEKELYHHVGVSTNLLNAKLSRIDITRNIITKLPTSCYIPILRNIKLNHIATVHEYDSTITFSSHRRAYAIYDKTILMKKRMIGSAPDANILRFEFRLLKGDYITKRLGIEDAMDMLWCEERIKRYFHDTVSREMFPEIKELSIGDNKLFKLLLKSKRSHGNKYLSNLMMLLGGGVLLDIYEIDQILDFVAEVELRDGKSKNTINKKINRTYKLLKECRRLGSTRNGVGLYLELRNKLLAV